MTYPTKRVMPWAPVIRCYGPTRELTVPCRRLAVSTDYGLLQNVAALFQTRRVWSAFLGWLGLRNRYRLEAATPL